MLAALGEERENRDGHYAYRAAPAFAETHSLAASNMAAVHAWLDQLLVRPMRAARASSTSAGAPPHRLCSQCALPWWCCYGSANSRRAAHLFEHTGTLQKRIHMPAGYMPAAAQERSPQTDWG